MSLLPHFVDLAEVEGAASLEAAFNAFDALEALEIARTAQIDPRGAKLRFGTRLE